MHRTHNPTSSAADTANPKVVTPATILRGAARYLEAHGWTQGVYYDLPDDRDPAATDNPAGITFPPACADGAIGMAAYGRKAGFPRETDDPGYRDYNRALDCLNDYLDRIEEPPPGDPAEWDDNIIGQGSNPHAWNDQPEQTAENVIATLRAAADDYDRTHCGGTR